MEQYKIILPGQQGKAAGNEVPDHALQQLNLPSAFINKIEQGKRVVLKKNLSLEQARRYQNHLTELGLNTKIGLSLSSQVFTDSLKPRTIDEKIEENTEQKEEAIEVCIVDDEMVSPRIVSLPKKYSLVTVDGVSKYNIKTHHLFWNPLLLLLASIAVALCLEVYLVRFVIDSQLFGYLATPLGVLFLMAAVVTLPRFLQPLLITDIQTEDEQVSIIEKESLILGSTTYHVINKDGQAIGHIRRKKDEAIFYDVKDQMLYQWNRKKTASESIDENLRELEGKIIENTLLDELLGYFDNIKTAFSVLTPRKRPSRVKWKRDKAQGVHGPSGDLLTRVYCEPYKAFEINTNIPPALSLVAFIVIVSKASVL